MSYPAEFVTQVQVLYKELGGDPERVMVGNAKELNDTLKLIESGPSPTKILECLDSQDQAELRFLAELGVRAESLRKKLRKNWREWCPNDPPGEFRASGLNPEGELLDI